MSGMEEKPIASIDDLGFSVRTRKLLEKGCVQNLHELIAKTADDLREISQFGDTCLREVVAKLAKLGLGLREPAHRKKFIDAIPPTQAIRQRMAELGRERTLLSSLLRVAEKKERDEARISQLRSTEK